MTFSANAAAYGAIGGLTKHARHGQAAAVAAGRAGQAGLRRRFATEIVARSGGMEPPDLAQRVDQAIRAHMRRLRLARTLQHQGQINQRIQAIVAPPVVCAWCYAERQETPPDGASHGICERHYREVRR